MKTKELIRQLQKEDPSGELDVCVGNVDIYFVEKLPGWYDGCQQIFIRDEDGYIVKAKYNSKIDKIKIHITSIEDLLLDYPDMVVDCKNVHNEKYYEQCVREWRKEAKDILNDIQNNKKG